MLARIFSLSAAVLVIGACTTAQENPNYKYSTKYKGSSPYQTTPTQTVQSPVPVSYKTATAVHQGTSYQSYEQCRQANMNRQIIGAGVGGSAGAVIGDKVVGGTAATVIGAVAGGAAGYAAGDATKQCEHLKPQPIAQQTYPSSYQATHSYSNYEPATTSQGYSQGYDQGYNTGGYSTQGTAGGYSTQTYPAAATIPSTPAPTPEYVAAVPLEPVATGPIQAPTDMAYADDTIGTPGYHAVMAAEQAVTDEPVGFGYSQVSPATVPAQTDVVTPSIMQGEVLHEVIENDTVYSLSRRQCVGVEDIQRINGLDATFNIRLGDFIKLPASRC